MVSVKASVALGLSWVSPDRRQWESWAPGQMVSQMVRVSAEEEAGGGGDSVLGGGAPLSCSK